MRGRHVFALGSVLLMLLTLVGCGGGAQEEAADPSAELWSDIESRRTAIDENKAKVEELNAALAAEPEDGEGDDTSGEATEPTEGDDGAAGEEAMTPEQIEAQISDLEGEIRSETDELYTKIIEYINNSGIVEGAELTPEQRRGFDWKAEIDMDYAQEYIDKGGDYKRAIDIYVQALMTDEGNPKLMAAKEMAEKLRYMDEERFGQGKKGMSQDEVQGLLGTVKNTNVRDFADKGRIGWFYPKNPEAGGGAAGVYFKEKPKGSENWIVEITDFDAVKGQSTEESDG